MRFFSYAGTVMPGPSYHCRPEFKDTEVGMSYMGMMPKDAQSVLIPNPETIKNAGVVCGDLMFSGHVYTNIISWYYFVTYSSRIFTQPGNGLLSKRMRLVIIAVDTACLIGLALSILASRQHYTVDVVTATYIGLLLPYWYELHLAPKEVDPYSRDTGEPLVSREASLLPSPDGVSERSSWASGASPQG